MTTPVITAHMVAEDLRVGDVIDLDEYSFSGEWEILAIERTSCHDRPVVALQTRGIPSELLDVEVWADDLIPVLRNTVDDWWTERGYILAVVNGDIF